MNIVVIGMGYPSTMNLWFALRTGVGIPCAALLTDVPGFDVTGIQRRSARSDWKIECLNDGECPFDGDEPGLAELIHRAHTNLGGVLMDHAIRHPFHRIYCTFRL